MVTSFLVSRHHSPRPTHTHTHNLKITVWLFLQMHKQYLCNFCINISPNFVYTSQQKKGSLPVFMGICYWLQPAECWLLSNEIAILDCVFITLSGGNSAVCHADKHSWWVHKILGGDADLTGKKQFLFCFFFCNISHNTFSKVVTITGIASMLLKNMNSKF